MNMHTLYSRWARSHVRALALAFAMAVASAPPLLAQDGPQKLPAIQLTAGMHLIQAEVAQSPDQRSIGLMHRKTMGGNEGMLFVFTAPQLFHELTLRCIRAAHYDVVI